jgi:hypothetical protein
MAHDCRPLFKGPGRQWDIAGHTDVALANIFNDPVVRGVKIPGHHDLFDIRPHLKPQPLVAHKMQHKVVPVGNLQGFFLDRTGVGINVDFGCHGVNPYQSLSFWPFANSMVHWLQTMVCNGNDIIITACIMFRFTKTITSFILALCLALPLAAQQEPSDEEKERALEGMGFMLQRAEFVRLLAAEHLGYLNANRDKAAFFTLEEASQVMAYNLICEDDAMEPRQLNTIAAQTTLQVSLLLDASPAGKTMAEAMERLNPPERLALIADVSTAVLMFKIGRRRGLFDALLTDFGNKRFCSGMGSDMRRRYNGLVANLPQGE